MLGTFIVALGLALIGVFTMLGGILDWDWFMNHSRARGFVQLFGRTGARVFYVLLGLGFVVLAVVAFIRVNL